MFPSSDPRLRIHRSDDGLDLSRPLHEQEEEMDLEDFREREPTFLERMAVKFRNFLLGEDNES